MINDPQQQKRSKHGYELEIMVGKEIKPMLEGTQFKIVGRKTAGNESEDPRPSQIKKNLQVPSCSYPLTEMVDPDCDLVIYNTQNFQIIIVIHVRMNIREVEKIINGLNG